MAEKDGVSTSCRIAGGWVRDKLLGAQSNDMDIALSDMMGFPFAERFVSFVSEEKNVEVGKISKVESNPEQSKHLETAKTKLFGIELEFVNLRSEEYTDDSRIPTQIKFGTPLEDALRRDITINALFYNVHSREVEDHTNKGLQDLKDGVVRTPLPPKETFMDDPLRVIRCIRFASRFGYNMVPELQDAARDPQIQSAVISKISRERVGEELDKMMKGMSIAILLNDRFVATDCNIGRDPLRSVHLINDLSLYDSVFPLPSSVTSIQSKPPSHPSTSLAAASVLHTLLSTSSLPPLHPLFTSTSTALDSSTKARLYFACALTPFAGITYTDAKGKVHPVVEAAIRECLKLGTQNHYLDGIPALFAAADVLRNPVLERFDQPSQRVAIGLVLRDKSVHNPNTGSHWVTSTLFSLVQELVSLWDPEGDELDVRQAAERIGVYNAFMSRIDELALQSAADMKPILTGRDVVAELNAKPGPWTGQALARVVEWQLDHPQGTKEECATWLRAEHAEGRIEAVDPKAPEQATGKRREGGGEKNPKKAKR
ncbi:hypothetical protein GLOTRDRAFT_69359 [Gloeophyllum trabeum ATCC 11539]|uniref:Poly A polymerase head domain-containing protein n=1 Tax=Gloeophyllum trabeum (strain ATCC 11539 / FP-39264 / Madison 617) TaxID=670483 RepID=S7QNK6_GLOTA|nr:uncharacterized protein GLOTRDRAFT_69359 [Gloeophyllum trabeum ATCC 11539]EPQ61126.1 hypothetical protein GLOTRDRAFT_69359 [Gloeophyllum trabeum ATCC 11539]